MTAAPQTPEIPEPEEVELHVIPPSTMHRDEKGTLSRNAGRIFFEDHGLGFIEILGRIAEAENLSPDLRSAGAYLAMDLRTLVEAIFRVEAGERVRVVEASDWRSPLERPDRLRSLAALASSAEVLFEDKVPAVRESYRALAAELEKRLGEDREGAR